MNDVSLLCSCIFLHPLVLFPFFLFLVSGSIKACKKVALKCDEVKFDQYKLVVGSNLSTQDTQKMQFYLDKIKGLEH